jgi:cell division septation protein DedD
LAEEENKSVIHITRRGVVIWIMLILFIASWMFVLGIMVGRGTAPVPLDAGKLQQELAELKAALTKKEQSEIEAQASGKGDQKSELGFYEALKQKKGQQTYTIPRLPENGPKPGPKTLPTLPVEVEPKPELTGTDPAAKSVTPATKPSPVPAEKPAEPDKPAVKSPAPGEIKPVAEKPTSQKVSPALAPPIASAAPASSGAFTIQVAAFQDSPSAEQMVAGLRGKGFPAYQIRSETPEKGVWYRVRVGAFKDRGAAAAMLQQLAAAQIKGIVVGTP